MSDERKSWVELRSAEPGLRTLTMNRPPVNALGLELVADLTRAIEGLGRDHEARVLVLRSGGKHFCAGADLKERRTMTTEEVQAFVPRLAGVCHGLAGLPFPTIAAVRGAAAGGGCELALACDLRILAADVSIGLRETALAIIPGAGGTQRLPRLIGPERAKRWIFTAELHDAARALEDGVAGAVVPADQLDTAAAELAARIAANGPLAVRLAKRAVEEGAGQPMREALSLEWELYQQTVSTQDRLEALEAFSEKRPPRFSGR